MAKLYEKTFGQSITKIGTAFITAASIIIRYVVITAVIIALLIDNIANSDQRSNNIKMYNNEVREYNIQCDNYKQALRVYNEIDKTNSIEAKGKYLLEHGAPESVIKPKGKYDKLAIDRCWHKVKPIASNYIIATRPVKPNTWVKFDFLPPIIIAAGLLVIAFILWINGIFIGGFGNIVKNNERQLE